jgi:hypothetical protein
MRGMLVMLKGGDGTEQWGASGNETRLQHGPRLVAKLGHDGASLIAAPRS